MSSKQAEQVLQKILEELEKLSNDDVTKKEVKKIVQHMVKQLGKKDIAEIAEDLTKQLDDKGIKLSSKLDNPAFLKTLIFAAISGKKIDWLLDPALTKNDLKKEIKLLLKEHFDKKGLKLDEKDLDQLAEKLTNYLDEKRKQEYENGKEPIIGLNDSLMGILVEELNQIALYGVSSTGIVAVATYVPGNATRANFSIGADENSSFMSDLQRAEPGKYDPSGIEVYSMSNFLSAVGGSLADEIEQSLSSTPTPFNTTPKPPGTVS